MEITRLLPFDYGHRVLGHGGKCRFLHGHRGTAEITVSAPALDSLGMVIDFGLVKEKLGRWIDDNWDHNVILSPLDPLLPLLQGPDNGREPYVLPEGNPTAENLAFHLFRKANELLPPPLQVVHVRVWETPSCNATITAEECQ